MKKREKVKEDNKFLQNIFVILNQSYLVKTIN